MAVSTRALASPSPPMAPYISGAMVLSISPDMCVAVYEVSPAGRSPILSNATGFWPCKTLFVLVSAPTLNCRCRFSPSGRKSNASQKRPAVGRSPETGRRT